MAGDWIKMRTNLPTDPRVVSISVAVKKSRPYVIGALFILWSLADEHSTDGRLDGYTAAVIDAATGIKGFAVAVQDAGWLTLDDKGSSIPRFDEHNGGTAKNRAQTARRQAHKRHAAIKQTSRSNQTSPSPRRDETREEKTTSAKPDVGAGPSVAAESVLIPRCETEARIRRWTGDRLSAGDRHAIARAERMAAEAAPVEIHGKPVPFADLFAKAVDEAIASDAKFVSGQKFMGLVDTIAARCARDGCWPGEGLERQNGRAPPEKTTAELVAIDKARRAKP